MPAMRFNRTMDASTQATSDHEDHAKSGDSSPSLKRQVTGQPMWMKLVLGLCFLLLVGGAILYFTAEKPIPAGSNSLDSGSNMRGASLNPAAFGTENSPPAEPSSAAEWSPIMLRLGFSFFAGFAMGYALRTFFKLVLIVAGVLILILMGMSAVETEKGQLLVMNWDAMGTLFDTFVSRLGQEAGNIKEFITGSLPTAALATVGLYAGWRKR